MRNQHGCITPAGLLVALLVVLGVVGYTLRRGGGLFSPGPLAAASSRGTSIDGFRSHAQLEEQCASCHRAWHGIDAERCMACHSSVAEQITAAHGLHGWLQNPNSCTLCHTEHKGREADITSASLDEFPHQKVGFSLVHHRRRSEGTLFECVDCHTTSDYRFDQMACSICHTKLDIAFMDRHLNEFGRACLACHDGSGGMAGFDHDAVFPLAGAHASLLCERCHVDDRYNGLASDCVACHAEPAVHLGKFGTDCEACHTDEAWSPAQLSEHSFPLDHGSRTDVDCQVCHPNNYVDYTCYGCHEHDVEEIQHKHLEEGIRDLENCVECHPTGRAEDEHRGRGEEQSHFQSTRFRS